MKKSGIYLLATFLAFLAEVVFFNFFGPSFRPQLILLLMMFINVRLGVKDSVIVAIFGGVLKDSFGVGVFGMHVFSLLACSYLMTLLKMYFYQKGYSLSRVFLVFVISSLYVFLTYLLVAMLGVIQFPQTIRTIFWSEVLSTTCISVINFKSLKQCVLKFSA